MKWKTKGYEKEWQKGQNLDWGIGQSKLLWGNDL